MDSDHSNNRDTSIPIGDLKSLIMVLNLKELCNQPPEPSKSNVHQCQCDNCDLIYFDNYRYKCLICSNYDLCSECFEKKRYNGGHSTSHPMLRIEDPGVLFGDHVSYIDTISLDKLKIIFKNAVHDVSCGGCFKQNIVGLLFKCDECKDLNICFECYSCKIEFKNHSRNHSLIVLGKPISQLIRPDQLELMDLLGRGGFGSVYKAKLKADNRLVACKIISYMISDIGRQDAELLKKSYIRELRAYNEIKGCNVLRMIGYGEERVGNEIRLLIVTEFMGKGSLSRVLDNEPELSFRRRLEIAHGISSGMCRIHELGYIHRDIRPDNILLTDNYLAKIGDMGIAKDDIRNQNTLLGCMAYMPPEFFTGSYTQKLDIFTYGLTIIVLFCGEHHSANNHPTRIKKPTPIFNSLIESCIDYDPKKRIESNVIEKYLKCFLYYIQEKLKPIMDKYASYSPNERNRLFMQYYSRVSEKLRQRQFLKMK